MREKIKQLFIISHFDFPYFDSINYNINEMIWPSLEIIDNSTPHCTQGERDELVLVMLFVHD